MQKLYDFNKYYLMYKGFREEDFGRKNQKFESFGKGPTKINSLLSEWWSLAQIIFDCLLYYWKTHPFLRQSHLLDLCFQTSLFP